MRSIRELPLVEGEEETHPIADCGVADSFGSEGGRHDLGGDGPRKRRPGCSENEHEDANHGDSGKGSLLIRSPVRAISSNETSDGSVAGKAHEGPEV